MIKSQPTVGHEGIVMNEQPTTSRADAERLGSHEARRLHNVLTLVEHAPTPETQTIAARCMCRVLRRFLADLHGLEATA